MSRSALSRRSLLGGAAALFGASLLPPIARADTLRYRRYEMTSKEGLEMLAAYEKAVIALLALPFDDPRNWYRNAHIHTMDCPHGNWWFVVWHRGYLGWFEQTVRDFSGNPMFAFPFWDWTKETYIPESFWKTSALNPLNWAQVPGTIPDATTYAAKLTGPLTDYYKTLSTDQLGQLAQRNLGYGTLDKVENLLATTTAQGADTMFFPYATARSLTPENPNFDARTKSAVSLPTVLSALKPTDFVTFGSGVVSQHSGSATQGVLESRPHNQVHNNIGGFMGNFLSPCDPIFFMHHSNIDRLWNTWTLKQLQNKQPTLPTGDQLAAWRKEPFLFYRDAAGRAVSPSTAENYEVIGSFDYDYAAGSGDEVLKTPQVAAAPAVSVGAKKLTAAFSASAAAFSTNEVAGDVVRAAAEAGANRDLYAVIGVKLPEQTNGVYFDVFVNAPPNKAPGLDQTSPSYAGSFQIHGNHAHDSSTRQFVVDISGALEKLAAAKQLPGNKPLTVAVVAEDTSGEKRALSGQLVSVEIHAY